nr:TlpA disulfide reductase family protein [Pseudenhygromyxa sp. WMMC2535]
MLFFVAVGGLLVFGFAQALGPAAEAQLGAACRPLNPEPREGAAPTLDLEDLEGNPVSLADFGGKFLIVNFWATWCEPCTREWPDLDQLAERLADRDDVVIVAVGVDQDKAEIGPYLERMGLSDTKVRVLWAKGAAAHEAFGSEKLPDTYFVDREGQLQSVFVNVRAWGKAAAFRCVESMI